MKKHCDRCPAQTFSRYTLLPTKLHTFPYHPLTPTTHSHIVHDDSLPTTATHRPYFSALSSNTLNFDSTQRRNRRLLRVFLAARIHVSRRGAFTLSTALRALACRAACSSTTILANAEVGWHVASSSSCRNSFAVFLRQRLRINPAKVTVALDGQPARFTRKFRSTTYVLTGIHFTYLLTLLRTTDIYREWQPG